jgi:hypothetical protein
MPASQLGQLLPEGPLFSYLKCSANVLTNRWHRLVEGSSIRSTERMSDIHRDTICRLLVQVGQGCAELMDHDMRELPCRRVQVDEIWAYVQKKQRHVTANDDKARVGDMWTFVALDPDTKLVPAYRVGKRGCRCPALRALQFCAGP